ncbi:MAG: helix-turn-helix domain-containing protein [Methylococcaceae bacterium]
MDGTDARNAKLKTIASLRKTIQQAKKGIAQRERKLRRLENSLLPNALDVKPEPISFDRITSKKEVEAIKVIASRMREARRLCEHTITQAAALLGVTQGDLKNIENVVDVDHVPLWLIKNASEVFNVPTDYLFGLIDDFDSHDPEVFKGRSLIASLQRQQLEEFTKTTVAQISLDSRLKAANTAVVAFGLATEYISEVFIQFRQLNHIVFDNLPGGAKVLRQIQLAEELGQHATAALTKYRCLPKSLAAHAAAMDEIFPNNNGSFAD